MSRFRKIRFERMRVLTSPFPVAATRSGLPA